MNRRIEMTDQELLDLIKRYQSMEMEPPKILVARSAELNMTPDVLARWVAQVSPLAEAEKVLKDWLETVGGVIYFDKKDGYGYYVQSNRKGFEGVTLRRDEPPFSTLAQCLEFCLNYAHVTIAGEEAGAAYSRLSAELADELVALDVDINIYLKALENLETKKRAEINTQP